MGAWSVILPEAGTNKIINPIALGTTGFTAIGAGAVTAVTTYSYMGYKCYRIVTSADNTGAYFTTSALANAIHYMTMRVHTTSDITPLFDCSVDNATWTEPTLLFTEGSWYVYGIQFPAAECNASVAFRVQQKGAGANDIYIGHIQVEENTYYTTPITGSRIGFCSDGYTWNGSEHASSSTRAAKERSGGKVVDLETTYDFKVLYGQGTGMPPIQHYVQGMALLPGALFQGSKPLPRVLDLFSGTLATTAAGVSAARRDFINAIKPDKVSPEQPVVFWYTAPNTNKPVEFHGYYDSGMEYQTTSGVIDKPSARFICYDPYAYETHTQGQELLLLSEVADADYIMRRTAGTWENISTQFNGTVRALARGTNGVIYIGGYFTDVVAAAGDRMVQWNPYTETLAVMGTGTSNNVYGLCSTPDGNIYATGDFVTADGTTVNQVARWNIDAADWFALTGGSGTGLDGSGYCLAYGYNGNLYIGGNYTLAGGITDTAYVSYWNGTEFYPLGTGMDDVVYSLAIAPNGDVYATGTFTTAGGTAAAGIAKWNGSAWSALGTGLTGGSAIGYSLVFDKASNLYVGGSFTAADGVSCNYIAKWNGKTFEPLGSGLDAACYRLAFDDNGLLYASGAFTTAGGMTLVCDKVAIWNGSTWAHLDADLPGAPTVYAILPVGDDLYLGYSTAGTGSGSGIISFTNNSSAKSYPVIKLNRSTDGTYAYVWYLKNNTTGATIWLNYSLVKGETLTLDFTPGNRSVMSSAFGDVWSAILRSSDFSSFFLQPGTNSISMMIPTDATCTGFMEWPLTHWGADMVAA